MGMSAILPLTKVAYELQQGAIRWSLVAAHLGLRRFAPSPRVPSRSELQELRRRLRDLFDRDFANVEAGAYPKELLFQIPVQEYVTSLPRLAAEVARMQRRARRGAVRELPEGVDLGRYPDYFRRNFHWQTDGYLSRRSAELYDLGVEFLFLGTADVMRRQVIPPLSDTLRGAAEPVRVLDVGCGTGRTLYQLSLAHPRHKYFGVDLSPFYVDRARELLAGRDVSLLVDNAENLPLRDASFDAAVSVFLFHELPLRARRNVLAEMHRVLKPGSLLVIEDAAQLSDAKPLEVFLDNFGRSMNEPFFLDYMRSDLEPELERAGFQIERVEPCFLSKVVVARAVDAGSRS
jgi:ubiquinone/menaquinone biosynthesis C-methylase UbiE